MEPTAEPPILPAQLPPTAPAQPKGTLRTQLLWMAIATAAFHAAYLIPSMAPLIVLFLYAVVRLSMAPKPRSAFYAALGVGLACYAPHLHFFYGVFGIIAVSLWTILAIWVGFFALLAWHIRRIPKLPTWAWAASLPILWTGIEYFRCELYYLRFAWLTPGIAFGNGYSVRFFGVYGTSFIAMSIAAVFIATPKGKWIFSAIILPFLGLITYSIFERLHTVPEPNPNLLGRVVGIQLENPATSEVTDALDAAVSQHPDAALLVLSEYTLDSAPSAPIKNWCRLHQRYLILGGKQTLESTPTDKNHWADTAFVIDPTGEVVFSQGKCVPIQFFDDGQPATEQHLWNSPWGNVGICICYDLSYSRVTDELIRQGADMLIVPTMDLQSWGGYEHELHARIAVVRAAEYHIHIIRVASSGISQAVSETGFQQTTAPYPGQGAMITARLYSTHSRRFTHIPPDRLLAPICTALTAPVSITLLAKGIAKKWTRRKLRVHNSAIPISAS